MATKTKKKQGSRIGEGIFRALKGTGKWTTGKLKKRLKVKADWGIDRLAKENPGVFGKTDSGVWYIKTEVAQAKDFSEARLLATRGTPTTHATRKRGAPSNSTTVTLDGTERWENRTKSGSGEQELIVAISDLLEHAKDVVHELKGILKPDNCEDVIDYIGTFVTECAAVTNEHEQGVIPPAISFIRAAFDNINGTPRS